MKRPLGFVLTYTRGANDIDHIELTLQHQGYAFPLESDDSILSTYPSRGIPIQNVTDISIEEFHQLFTQVDQSYCLETPHDIWPTR